MIETNTLVTISKVRHVHIAERFYIIDVTTSS